MIIPLHYRYEYHFAARVMSSPGTRMAREAIVAHQENMAAGAGKGRISQFHEGVIVGSSLTLFLGFLGVTIIHVVKQIRKKRRSNST